MPRPIGSAVTVMCAAALVMAPGAALAVPGITAVTGTTAVPVTSAADPAAPITDRCPHREVPPPAVDTSEVVAPGSATPAPVPVPAQAVGGDRLGECGVIADPAAGPVPGRLTSAGWLVADLDTGAVIAAKDPHGRYRPASTIKTLLALVVADALSAGKLHLEDVVTPDAEDWSQEGDSCGMGPGGHYTVRDLLNGLLVVSGNDCAHALARTLGGVATTLTMMNDTAKSIHALDTRATTPSGLDAAGMATSPYDLALIFRAALSHQIFREIIATTTYHFPGYPPRSDVPGDPPHPGYEMQTSDHLLLQGYPGMIGGKTGYTDDALKTFVGAAQRDNRTVLIVQMYGLSTADNNYWTQAADLLDYGFRAPAEVRVGDLVAGPNSSTSAPPPASTQPAEIRTPRATSTSDSTSATSVRVLIGLVAALVLIALLAAATRLIGRKRK